MLFSLPLRRFAMICTLPALLADQAAADPVVGFGLSIAFGRNQPEFGAGVRVFSNDEQDEVAATLGLDYMFRSQSWRGSLGAAYLMDNSYIGFDGGYNFNSSIFDFAIGGGWADTTETPAGGGSGGGGTGGGGTGGSGPAAPGGGF